MLKLLKGAPVADALTDKMKRDILDLATRDIRPTLAIVRAGERPDCIAYERSVMKRCASVGVGVRSVALPEDVESHTFYSTLKDLNTEQSVHGVLLLSPLPPQLDADEARVLIAPAKDVDGCTNGSLGGVFTGEPIGFSPCTPEAVMEMLAYYGISCEGRRAVVIGRSLVVGRPLSMMLLHENATVTLCHTKTPDVASIAREADLLISCAGQRESIGADYVSPGQIVIDVGTNFNPATGGLCGDVNAKEVEKIVAALSPVPGGVGTVTSTVLVSHVVEAAKRMEP